jgi:hypothetical protein
MAKRVRTRNGWRCQNAKGKFIRNSACGLKKKKTKKRRRRR